MVQRPALIIIPLYRNAELVKGLFSSLIRSASDLDEIQARILLINDSPEDTIFAAALRQELPALERVASVELITNEQNKGFVESANLGLRAAISDGRDAILLNSDIQVFPGALREIRNVAYTDHMIGFVSPRSNNATICSLPPQREYRNLPPDRSYKNFLAISGFLPRVSYVPTAVGFCMFIKFLILQEFGIFDPVYGQGYNEENDLVMRANRCGYRAALANHAFVYHIGEHSFRLTNGSPTKKDVANRKILASRYPEYLRSRSRYLASPEYSAEFLLAGFIPVQDGRLRIAFDCTHMGPSHSGTYESARKIIAAVDKEWSDKFMVEVICSAEVFAAQGFPRLKSVSRAKELDARPYAAIIRIGQPFSWESFFALSRRAPIIVLSMLDTIALDCSYIDEWDLKPLWGFTLMHADGLIYISKHSQDQFRSRFQIPKHVTETVSLLSLDVREYFDAPATPEVRNDHIVVIGNHFKHKYVEETVSALRVAAPEKKIVVLGVKMKDTPMLTSYEAGRLDNAIVNDLYLHASVVVFPSHYEGFGLPLLHALARRKPIIVRALPSFQEILAGIGGSKNVHIAETTADIARLAAGKNLEWADESILTGPSLGWDRSASEIRQNVETAISRFDYHHLVQRLTAIPVADRITYSVDGSDGGHPKLATRLLGWLVRFFRLQLLRG